MRITKKDALDWFKYLITLDETENIYSKYDEIITSIFLQIEDVVRRRNKKLLKKIENLKSLDNRTYFVGNEDKFPKGCYFCLKKDGLTAIRKTHRCNLNCKFCYYYDQLDDQPMIGEGIWSIGGTSFYEEDIDLLLSIYGKPSGISYVYLEPFMEIDKYYSVIKKFKEYNVYQHMYTNGTLATEKNLEALGKAGLDELRFNLGACDCSDGVIKNMKLAKKYIKSVGIETPMTPEFFEDLLSKKEKVLETGIDFLNCAELHLNEQNMDNYKNENIYISRNGYISPIWSRELTLKLMNIADNENWDLVVHDCSNSTKFSRDLNASKNINLPFGTSVYGSEFSKIPIELFLPVLSDDNFKFNLEEELPKKSLSNI